MNLCDEIIKIILDKFLIASIILLFGYIINKKLDFFRTNLDLRKQIDDLNWLLIESTLEEQKNDSALEKLEKLKDSNTKPFFLALI